MQSRPKFRNAIPTTFRDQFPATPWPVKEIDGGLLVFSGETLLASVPCPGDGARRSSPPVVT